MSISSSDVLIVGAGPTGLTLACLLARQGVRHRIVDASPGPQVGSRGKGLQPRTLELLDDLGVVADIVAAGSFTVSRRLYDEDGAARVEPAAAGSRPDAPYLSVLLIPQWRVEEALRARLRVLGGNVEFGAKLAGLTQHEDGVAAKVEGAEGLETIRARWLVGCDGGKSTVRHLVEIDFLGETLETHRMLLGDVQLSGLDREHWHIWRSRQGFLALCPLPSTNQFQFQASVGPGQEYSLAIESFREVVEQRSGRRDIQVSDVQWMSLWRANIRMVDRYRSGRVLIAGDAAHVHSPAGGQGMNTGIQDAVNLAWKLGSVLAGADESLIDTYQQERLPVAAEVLGLSNRLMAEVVATGTLALKSSEETLQLGINYRQSSLSRELRAGTSGLRAGDRAPDAPGLQRAKQAPLRMFDLLRGPEVTLLGFGPRWQPILDACAAVFGDRIRSHIVVECAGDARHYVDAAGHARAAYGDDALFVIRADHYVGYATAAADSQAIIDYLRGVLGLP
jgi:2-polyprenyl-6-methoxyphenol hydroxylase-like FAD-dependent oxidoreductase